MQAADAVLLYQRYPRNSRADLSITCIHVPRMIRCALMHSDFFSRSVKPRRLNGPLQRAEIKLSHRGQCMQNASTVSRLSTIGFIINMILKR